MLTTASMQEVYRSENILARVIPCEDTSRWVVTFDNYGLGHGFAREGFSEVFLKEKGISAIHIMGRREDWYRYSDISDALGAVKSFLSGANLIITYGSSMGGYAALRFADQLGADYVLAISPQYTIDPTKVPFETRWRQDASRIDWDQNPEPPLPRDARPVVVYDPTTADKHHIALIGNEVSINTIPIRYSGHPSGWMLADMHLLSPLLHSLLEGKEDTSFYKREIRRRKGTSSTYLANLSRAVGPRHPSWALALAKRAVEIKPTHVDALHCLADCLCSQNDGDAAMHYYEAALAASNSGLAGLVPLAEALSRSQKHDLAMRLVREASRLPETQEMAHIHAWHGMLAWKAGHEEEAVAAVNRALALHPTEPTYKDLLSLYTESNQNTLGKARNFFSIASSIRFIIKTVKTLTCTNTRHAGR